MNDVTAFFESYRAAFERLDASAIADHFAYPGHMTTDTGEIVLAPIATREEWIGQIERLVALYRTLDVRSARILDLETTELSRRLVHAVVHWALHDGMARLLYAFEATYTLAQVGADGLRITALAHNELPRYREYLAHRR
jgi:hypothetical protein